MTICSSIRNAIVLGGFALSAACSGAPAVPEQTAAPVPAPLPGTYPLTSVVVTLDRRWGCEGFCAIYRADLHGDGRVVYHGYAYVGEAGMREGSIDPQEVSGLLEHLYEIRFFDMPATFQSTTYADTYPAAISVRIGEYEREMIIDVGVTAELGALPQAIYELAGLDRWVR